MNNATALSPRRFALAPTARPFAAGLPRPVGSVTLDRRHNGPRNSANGGLAAGSFAALVGSPARVVLRARVPLGVPLQVTTALDGGFTVRRRSRLVAEVTRLERGAIVRTPPVVPSLEQALAASLNAAGLERGHPLAHCWVCSRYRADGLGVEPGLLPGHPGVFVARFLAPGTGEVPEAHVWAALDCPSYPVQAVLDGRVFVLGTQAVELHRPVPAGANYAIVGWTEGGSARTYRTASVLIDAAGEVLASCEAIWVELKGHRARPRALASMFRSGVAIDARPIAFRPERLSPI